MLFNTSLNVEALKRAVTISTGSSLNVEIQKFLIAVV